MSDLKAMCEEAGFQAVRTYIASGNVVFRTGQTESAAKAALETRLHALAGKPVWVLMRTGAQMADILAQNPFADMPPNRVAAIFLDHPASSATLNGLAGQAADESVALGLREIYVLYGSGMGQSKLRIPHAKTGTARNMNTVAKLAAMAAE